MTEKKTAPETQRPAQKTAQKSAKKSAQKTAQRAELKAMKKSTWGKPEQSEKQDHSLELSRLASNLLTLLMALLIIGAGFLLPTLLYPHIDSYNNTYVQLNKPAETSILNQTQRQVRTYPWNSYDASRLRNLTDEESSKLASSKTAEFLVALMQDHGMTLQNTESHYLSKILGDFRCLEPGPTQNPRCFVLYDEDLNADGTADLRCAVDYDGKIISMILLDESWDYVQLNKAIDVSGNAENAGAGVGVGSGDTAAEGGVTDEAAAGAADDTATDAAATEGAGTTDNATADNTTDNATGDNTTLGNTADVPEVLIMPSRDDQSIWSFIYAASREAYIHTQTDLFNALRQLDIYYERYYGYPFYALLPDQSVGPEQLLNDPLYTAISAPQELPTDEYQLHIYRLPSGVELILYIDPQTQHCVGFSMQQYMAQSS